MITIKQTRKNKITLQCQNLINKISFTVLEKKKKKSLFTKASDSGSWTPGCSLLTLISEQVR